MKRFVLVAMLMIPFVLVRADDPALFKRFSKTFNLKGEKYLNQAEEQFEQGQYAQAFGLYDKYLKKSKERDPRVLYRMAVCAYELGEFSRGYPLIEEAHSKDQDDLDYHVMLGEYHVSMQDGAGAAGVYRDIVKRHPDDYLSYVRLGELLVDQGDLPGARESWLAAIERDPNKTDAYDLMAQSYLHVEKNRLEAYYYARKQLEVADEQSKPAAQYLVDQIAGDLASDYDNYFQSRNCMDQARAFFQSARFDDAYRVLSNCRDLSGLPGDYFLLFGKVCDEVGKFKDAVFAYERCLALGMENGDICYRLGWSYLNSGDRKNAEIAFKRSAGFEETRVKAQKMLEQIRQK